MYGFLIPGTGEYEKVIFVMYVRSKLHLFSVKGFIYLCVDVG
jgi:hypothetical protein